MSEMIPVSSRQRAALALRFGRNEATAEVEVTPAGLLAIGALVSSILLSSAAIVVAAKSGGRREC